MKNKITKEEQARLDDIVLNWPRTPDTYEDGTPKEWIYRNMFSCNKEHPKPHNLPPQWRWFHDDCEIVRKGKFLVYTCEHCGDSWKEPILALMDDN